MMKESCLQAEVRLVSRQIKANASLICGFNLSSVPLLVDEGLLYVDDNGISVKLYVKRGHDRNK